MSKKPTKQEMINFLLNHFRYDTMNSWNRAHSYAANVKVHKWVPRELLDKAFQMLDIEEAFHEINDLLHEFAVAHDFNYQVGFNGRSSGYLVLYVGGKHASGQVYSQPGVGMDMDEFGEHGNKFTEWTATDLHERYKLVKEFDALVDTCKAVFLHYCKTYKVVEKTVDVPTKVKVLERVK